MKPSDIPKILADANGVDESTALALMATAINGMVGRLNKLDEHPGLMQVPPMEAIVADDDGSVADFFDRLLDPARSYQKLAGDRFRETDTRLLDELLLGQKGSLSYNQAFETIKTAVHGKEGDISRVEHPFEVDLDCRPIDHDLQSKGLIDRLELIVRPDFLIEAPSVTTLSKDLQNLHMGCGLISGGPKFKLSALTDAAVKKFQSRVKSERLSVPEVLTGGRKGMSQEPYFAWVIHAVSQDFERLGVRNLLRDALLLDGALQSSCQIPDGKSVVSAQHAWAQTVGIVLKARRRGKGSGHGLAEESSRIEFEERYREYRSQCHALGLASRTVLQLPKLLLCLPVKAELREVHRLSVEECFQHSEVLRKRHLLLLHQVQSSSQVSEVIRLAERILERIRARAPLSQRDLIRSFDKQRAELYVPTLELMLQAGVIEEKKPKVYLPGKTQDLEACLRPLLTQQQLKVVA